MGRIHVQDVTLDTSDFTPFQLQTRFVLRGGMKGWAGWAGDYLAPFNELIAKHGFGLVVLGVDVDWNEPFRFFDSPALQVRTAIRIRRDRRLLEGECRFDVDGRTVVRSLYTMLPIRVADSSLAAEPAEASDWLFERFEEDEIFDEPRLKRIEGGLDSVVQSGECVASGVHDFRVRRHDAEFADQWSYIEVPGIAAAAREELVLGDPSSEVAGSLARPLARMEAEFTRPLFVYDEARVATEALRSGDGLEFVHRIESAGGRHR
ncbi:MAG TPA: hypothetical protein VM184_08945, partial [Gaiellaceae bacterium]|nr:hypothetical protein [Gaiellaceae bacterium]